MTRTRTAAPAAAPVRPSFPQATFARNPADIVGHHAPTSLGRYVVLGKLGEGAMGTVYRVYDPILARELALVHPLRLSPNEEARLFGEAEALAKLSHPNVVRVYDASHLSGQVVLMMELVRGTSLWHWQRGQSRSLRESLAVYRQAGTGLAAAHRAGLIHRDFKPENVMVDDSGRVVVMDFGLARTLELGAYAASSHWHGVSAIGSPGRVPVRATGTPLYMAPEQHFGLPLSAASDQYAFAVALWEALCGEPPFMAGNADDLGREKRRSAPQWPRGVRVPRSIRAALRRALATQPEHRWPNMDALLGALDLQYLPNRSVGFAAMGAVAVLASGWAWTWHAERSARCSGANEFMAGVWDGARRSEVERALLGTELSYAPATWTRVEVGLDRYAAAWRTRFTEACQATSRAEHSQRVMDLQMTCLQRQRGEFAAAIDILVQADARVLEQAVEVVEGLPAPARCADVDALAGEVAEPSDRRTAAAVAAAREPLARARALLRAGHYERALLELDEAERRLAEVEHAPTLAAIANERGEAFTALSHHRDAERVYARAFDVAVAAGRDAAVSRAARGLADLGFRTARYDEAERLSEVAIGVAHGCDCTEELAQVLSVRSALLHARGRFEQARASARRGLRLLAGELGPDHLALARAHDAVGATLTGKAALQHHRRALAIRETALGPEHPDVALALNNMAAVLHDEGQLEAAVQVLRRALAIREQALGASHPKVAGVHFNLGATLSRQGNYAQAVEHMRAALVVYRRVYGDEHPDVAVMRNNLGLALGHLGHYEQADRELRRAWAIRRRTLVDNHLVIARSMYNVASMAMRRGRHGEAERLLVEALRVNARSGEAGTSLQRTLRLKLSQSLVAGEKFAQARDLLESELAERSALSARDRAESSFLLARTLWALGRDRIRAVRLARAAADWFAEAELDERRGEVADWLAARKTVASRLRDARDRR